VFDPGFPARASRLLGGIREFAERRISDTFYVKCPVHRHGYVATGIEVGWSADAVKAS
jgi:hypothetical protein